MKVPSPLPRMMLMVCEPRLPTQRSKMPSLFMSAVPRAYSPLPPPSKNVAVEKVPLLKFLTALLK